MAMSAKLKAIKAALSVQMRQVPVGGVFLITNITGGGMVLYMRTTEHRVRCFVSTVGEVFYTTDTMLISRPWFTDTAQIVLLPEAEQNKRIMLAHHGYGLRAIAPWEDGQP